MIISMFSLHWRFVVDFAAMFVIGWAINVIAIVRDVLAIGS